MPIVRLLLPPLLAILPAAYLAAAVPARSKPEYQVKAQVIRRLLDYLEWPNGNGDPRRPLVIAVLDPSPFEDFLPKELENAVINGRSVKLRLLRGLSQISQCDVLFVPETSEANLGSILENLKGRPIVVMGDTPGFASRGVPVNLPVVDGRIRLEVNLTALKNTGIQLSPQVMKGATIYR